MNWKVALALLLVFSTVVGVTLVVSQSTTELNTLGIAKEKITDTDIQFYGDPIGDPSGPHRVRA